MCKQSYAVTVTGKRMEKLPHFKLKESQYYIKDPYRYPGYCRLERVGRGMG